MHSVLIVDDNAGFRRQARALLEADGFEVVGEASSGAAGLSAAAELHPDFVLLDVQLPDLDGFEIAQQLQTVNGTIAVVLTSSRDRSDYGSLVDDSPARGFVAKGDLSGPAIAALLG